MFFKLKKMKRIINKLISSHDHQNKPSVRGLILNILLLFSLITFFIINLIRLGDFFLHPQTKGLPFWVTAGMLVLFIVLYLLSKRGFIKTAASVFLSLYSIPPLYCLLFWGSDLPAALLMAVLGIIVAGVLFGETAVLFGALFLTIFLISVTKMQADNLLPVHDYWRLEKAETADAIVYSALFLIIAIIAWLFCFNTKRALERARNSEEALKKERDNLEIKVQERTAQLRRAESEKISQLYRLAEFGRLSSGIFHDLVNPLTAISLNLGLVEENNQRNIANAKSCLAQAMSATKKIEGMVSSIKKQLQKEGEERPLQLKEEVEEVTKILTYKARKSSVDLTVKGDDKLTVNGDPVKFSQIILNLIANAIDACEEKSCEKSHLVTVDLSQENNFAKITVSDNGCGISQENISKIFEPFFSTKKKSGRGLGIGLSSTKDLIEKYFHGHIEVFTQENYGSRFTVYLPFNYEQKTP